MLQIYLYIYIYIRSNVLLPCPCTGRTNGGEHGKSLCACACFCAYGVCGCVSVFVCAFLGRASLRPLWRDNIINLYASDITPLREENSRQSRDTASTLQITHTLMHMHTHEGFSSMRIYVHIIHRHMLLILYFICMCKRLIF